MPPKKGRGRYGFSFRPPLETVISSGGTIGEEVSTEAGLIAHPDILWYADLTDMTAVTTEFNMHKDVPTYENGDLFGPAAGGANRADQGPRFYFQTNSEFSGSPVRFGGQHRVVRIVSKSLTPDTRVGGNGSTNLHWWKFINQATLVNWRNNSWAYSSAQMAGVGGTGVGSIEERDLYARFCMKLAPSYFTGINEIAVKLSGLERWAENVGGSEDSRVTGYAGGPLWHDREIISSQNRFFANTYWFGLKPTPLSNELNPERETYEFVYTGGGTADGGQAIIAQNGFETSQTNRWYTFEQHLKINTFTGTTPNPDAELEFWFEDQLCYSRKNFVLSAVPVFTGNATRGLNEITKYHIQWFHGGGSTPLTPMEFWIGGICLSRRRIGKAKLV